MIASLIQKSLFHLHQDYIVSLPFQTVRFSDSELFTSTPTVALTPCRLLFCVGTRCLPPPCPQQVPEKRQGLLSGKHAAPRGSPCFRENRFLTSSRAKTSSYADLSSGKENKERLPTVAIRYDGDRTTVSMVMQANE